MDYLIHNLNDPVDVSAFEAASGVGVTVTPDQIEDSVSVEGGVKRVRGREGGGRGGVRI